MLRIAWTTVLCACLGTVAFAADPARDDGMQPYLEQLFDPNAQVDRIVDHRSQQMSLKAERARIDMKQSAPNRARIGAPAKPAAPRKPAPTASVKPPKPKPPPPKPAPPRLASPTPSTPAK